MKDCDTEQPSFFEALYTSRNADAHEICTGIFLGAASAAGDQRAMLKRKISHVLIAHPALPEQYPRQFQYRRIKLIDDPAANLLELLPDALSFLGKARKRGGRVFVYCAKGISRSSSIVIALLMLEQGISFDEAFHACEQKRPVVYPNVGFQQQLRYFEKLMRTIRRDGSWEDLIDRLHASVPKGSLEDVQSPLHIRDAIGTCMGEALAAVEKLASQVFAQPVLLQKQELWKRHGLFFENLHKYRALPSDLTLVERGRATAARLKTLPKVFSESLRGVKLGVAVAKEIDAWVAFAEPLLAKHAIPTNTNDGEGSVSTQPKALAVQHGVSEPPIMAARQLDAKQNSKRTKKSKKEKKLEKMMAQMEDEARQAEKVAQDELQAAIEVARHAEETLAKLDDTDAQQQQQQELQESVGEATERTLPSDDGFCGKARVSGANTALDEMKKARARATREAARLQAGCSSSESSSEDERRPSKKHKR